MQGGGGIPRCRGGPQHYTDVSRRGCFGGRPSDILNSLGLDNPISGCQLGLILEALRSWLTAFVCVPDESCFWQFSSERFAYEATQTRGFPTKIATLPLVPPRFWRSTAFCQIRATFEGEKGPHETNSFNFYFFILEIGMNIRARACWSRRTFWVPPHLRK